MRRSFASSIRLVFLAATFGLSAGRLCLGGDWPGWRGPTGYGATDQKDLPLSWDGKSGAGVLWKVPLKGLTGHSSPIVWGDKVFITTADKQTQAQESAKEVPAHHVACYSAADGRQLWNTAINPGKEPAGYAIYAVPTPVTDGKAVYAWFGSAVMVAVDFDGKLLWRQERAGPFKLNPGIDSSPVLYQDNVLLLCDEGGGLGWLQALDKRTGETVWEKKRTQSSYGNTTPVTIDVNGKPQLLVQGGNALEGLDPSNGNPIWSVKASGFGSSPVYGSGLVFSDSGNGEVAFVVDPTGHGDVTATHVKWRLPKVKSQYGSAAVFGDWIYRASEDGVITCRTLSKGDQLFSESAKDVSKLASPIATSDGRIYFVSSGTSYVLRAGPKFEVLATNELEKGDNNAASAAVSNGHFFFIRGSEALYCIGKP